MHGACFFGQEYLNGVLVRIERGDFVGKAARPHLHVGPLLPPTWLRVLKIWGWAGLATLLHCLLCPVALFSFLIQVRPTVLWYCVARLLHTYISCGESATTAELRIAKFSKAGDSIMK